MGGLDRRTTNVYAYMGYGPTVVQLSWLDVVRNIANSCQSATANAFSDAASKVQNRRSDKAGGEQSVTTKLAVSPLRVISASHRSRRHELED